MKPCTTVQSTEVGTKLVLERHCLERLLMYMMYRRKNNKQCGDGTPTWNTYQENDCAPTMVSGLGWVVLVGVGRKWTTPPSYLTSHHTPLIPITSLLFHFSGTIFGKYIHLFM